MEITTASQPCPVPPASSSPEFSHRKAYHGGNYSRARCERRYYHLLRNPGAPFAVWEEPVAASPIAQLSEKSAFDDGWPPSNRGLGKSQQKKARLAAQKMASVTWGLDDEFEAASPVIGLTEDSTTNLDSLFGQKQSNEAEASSSTPPSVETPPSNEPSEPIMPEQEEQGDVHYYVSSRHLALASGFFKSSLAKDGWIEGQPSAADGKYRLSAMDWDPEAFLILLQIMHLRNRHVPRSLTLEMLAKMAVLVDYYRCREAIEVFSEMWIKFARSTSPMPSTYGRNLVLWMCVAWVFKLPTEFEQTTKTAFSRSRIPTIQGMGLPIPKLVLDGMEHKRYQSIEELVSALHSWLDKFREPSYSCNQGSNYNFACSSMLLGSLTKEMDRIGCWSPRPEAPFYQLSFEELYNNVSSLEVPAWSPYLNGYYAHEHPCGFHDSVRKGVNKIESKLAGLHLQDFKDRGEH